MVWRLCHQEVGWPELQEGRSRRQKSDLAHSCMQHPLGNTFSCSLMFTNEAWVPKRAWVKTVAGIPKITLTLLIQISPGIWLELICISSQGLIRIRVIGMVAGGRRQKARVWSLLNNPGHCPAPPKATHSITFPCPHTQVITLPHSPATSQVPGPTVIDQGPCSRMKLSNIMDKAICPFSYSLPASRKKKQSNKSVWMVSGYVQKRRRRRKRKGQITDISMPELFSQNSIFGGRKELLLLVVTPSSAPSRLGKQVTLHLRHSLSPPTPAACHSPVCVPS